MIPTQRHDPAAVLALIVLIRAILSLTLEFEIEGRWAWQGGREKT